MVIVINKNEFVKKSGEPGFQILTGESSLSVSREEYDKVQIGMIGVITSQTITKGKEIFTIKKFTPYGPELQKFMDKSK